MRILDTPRINRCGSQVYYLSPYGQCARGYGCPNNTVTSSRQHVRSGFGYYSRAWSSRLTEAGRQAWIVAGGQGANGQEAQSGGLADGPAAPGGRERFAVPSGRSGAVDTARAGSVWPPSHRPTDVWPTGTRACA